MQYKYITNNMVSIPKVIDQNGTPKLECNVNCVSGVVGDTYGFYKTYFLTLYTDITLTIAEVQQSLTEQCTEWVATNYPDTITI